MVSLVNRQLMQARRQMEETIARLNGQEESLWLTLAYGPNLSELSLMLKLCKAIKTNRTLRAVELFSTRIGDLGMEMLAAALAGNEYLRNADIKIRLINCGIGELGAMHLAHLMKKNSGIEEIDIANNSIGDAGLLRIVDVLKNHPGVTALDLTDNNIWRTGANALGNVLKTNEHLLSVDIDENAIGCAGVKSIAYALEYNYTLTLLNLNGCSVADAGASYLARGLRLNNTVRILTLKNNRITSKGGKALATMIRKNKALEEIYLCSNLIDDNITEYLAEALTLNRTLFCVSLRYNSIGDEGAENLARMVPFNRTLMTLNLRHNLIGDKGASYLVKALMLNSSLMRLNLMYNKNTTFNADWHGIKYDRLEENERTRKNMFLSILNSDRKSRWKWSTIVITGLKRAGKSSTVRSLLKKPFNEIWCPTSSVQVSECEVSKANGWKHLRDNEGNYSKRFAMRIMLEGIQNSSSPITAQSYTIESDSDQMTVGERNDSINTSVVDKGLDFNSETTGASVKPSLDTSPGDEDVNELHIADNEGDFDEVEYVRVKRNMNGYHFRIVDQGCPSMTSSCSMHSMSSTSAQIYLIIFDMRQFRDQDQESIKSVSALLNSIKSWTMSAHIQLVGTYANEVKSAKDIFLVNTTLSKIIKSSARIVYNKTDQLVFFPIDNKDYLGIQNLRKNIESAVRRDKTFRREISVKWIRLLDLMMSKKSDSIRYLLLSEIKDLAKARVGIKCSFEIEDAMRFFHSRGMIIYITSTEAVKSLVILDPQWLDESVAKIVPQDGLLSTFNKAEIESIGLGEDLRVFSERSLVSRDFLEYVWDKQEVDFLLDYLKATMFLSEWKYVQKGDEALFLIPSLLHKTFEGKLDGLQCVVDFSKSFVSREIFYRLVCLLVSYCGEYRRKYGDVALSLEDFNPELYRNFASITCVPGYQFRLHYDSDLNRIVALITNKSLAARTLQVFQGILEKAKSDTIILGANKDWEILLEDGFSSELIEYSKARKQKLLPWFDEDVIGFGHRNDSVNLDFNNLF